jgi:hypothetical protein
MVGEAPSKRHIVAIDYGLRVAFGHSWHSGRMIWCDVLGPGWRRLVDEQQRPLNQGSGDADTQELPVGQCIVPLVLELSDMVEKVVGLARKVSRPAAAEVR